MFGCCRCAKGLFAAFLLFLTVTFAACSGVIPNSHMYMLAMMASGPSAPARAGLSHLASKAVTIPVVAPPSFIFSHPTTSTLSYIPEATA